VLDPNTQSITLTGTKLDLKLMNDYIDDKCGLSKNFGSVLAFIYSLSYEERVQIVKRCCTHRRKSLFKELDVIQLFKTEILYNTHTGTSFDEKMMEEMQSNFSKLVDKLNEAE